MQESGSAAGTLCGRRKNIAAARPRAALLGRPAPTGFPRPCRRGRRSRGTGPGGSRVALSAGGRRPQVARLRVSCASASRRRAGPGPRVPGRSGFGLLRPFSLLRLLMGRERATWHSAQPFTLHSDLQRVKPRPRENVGHPAPPRKSRSQLHSERRGARRVVSLADVP